MALKDVWKSALEEYGALSVMTTGATLMLKLCVTSWTLHKQVRHHQTLHKRVSLKLLRAPVSLSLP